jgi:hypothetical protein
MTTKYSGAQLPYDHSSWLKATQKYETCSIHELESADSASEITVEQFLSLKVLWSQRLEIKDLYADDTAGLYNSSKVEVAAVKDNTEKQDEAWKEYLQAIHGHLYERSSKFSRKLGVYALVLQAQLEASRIQDSLNDSISIRSTPYPKRDRKVQEPKRDEVPRPQSLGSRHHSQASKSTDGPEDISPMKRAEALSLPIGDEQIVNTAAINFLNALFIHEARPADWTLERKQFKFNSKSVKFEARMDGHFQLPNQARSAAILEVKPRLRALEQGFRIEMQESAQMALWIFQEPNSHWAPARGGDRY